ncbi:UNVERIFIED_CONTAM: hypothetical protein K2H54_031990 [Gekko kuhli]
MQNREEERPSEFKAEILQLPFVTVTSNKPVPEETTAEVTVQVKIENEESEIALQLPASKQTSSDISIVSSEENKLSQNTCLLESASEKLEHASAADISIATQVDGTLTVEAKRVEIAEVFNVHLPNPKGGKTFSEILIPCQTTEPLIPKKRAVLQNLKELPEATPTELRQLTKVKLLDKQGEDTLQELFIFLRDVTHRLVIDKHFGDFAKLADWYKVPEYETVIQQPMDLSATSEAWQAGWGSKVGVMDQPQPKAQEDSDLPPEPSLGEDQSDLQPEQSHWQLKPSVSKDSSEVEPESSMVKDDFTVEDTTEFQSDNTELSEVREQVPLEALTTPPGAPHTHRKKMG